MQAGRPELEVTLSGARSALDLPRRLFLSVGDAPHWPVAGIVAPRLARPGGKSKEEGKGKEESGDEVCCSHRAALF